MKRFTSLVASTALMITGTAVQAGGLSDEIVEPVVIMEEEPMAAGSSISPTVIVLGILGALLIAAAVGDDDDDEEELALGSDMRLKQDITQIGTAANGLPLYSYRYIGHDQLFSGVMAQDVLHHTPEAVVTLPGGLMAVNYDMLGLKMERIN
ncbi:tail fiber domain-containing protein [Yoonia algicola]|uniref:Tail fiber domain-containing protein n=1 Tax=Yoonia algicola TaxID=3137368 RepID=A0AAN0NFZ2_9RHOB